MRNHYLAAVMLLALTGCATKAKWEHPQLAKSSNAEDVATMALAECESYAAGRTPMPMTMPYMPVPAPTTYGTTGTYTQYGNYGTFQSTTTTNSIASSYAAGANMGANIANAYLMAAAAERQKKLTGACMRSLGWVDRSTPEGEQKLQAAMTTQADSLDKASAQPAQADNKGPAEVNAFFDWASQNSGVDYRIDDLKYEALKRNVSSLFKDPSYRAKPLTDVLKTAHAKVLQEFAQPK